MVGGRLFRLGVWLKLLRENLIIVWFAWRHPLTPGYVKGLLALVLIYFVSPIDILPDYIPFLGIADDVGLVTGVMLYLKYLLPEPVYMESKRQSEKLGRRMPYILGAVAIAAIVWIALVIKLFHKVFFE